MSKMEKYKYLPYPNYNYASAVGLPPYYTGPAPGGIIPPVQGMLPPFTAPGFVPPYQSTVIDPSTGLPTNVGFDPKYPYPYPFLHPYAFIPPTNYPYTINMNVGNE